jgi:hypothetical protein
MRAGLKPKQNNRDNYSFVYFNLYVFKQHMGRQKILNCMVASSLNLVCF